MIFAKNSNLPLVINCTFDQRDANILGTPNEVTAIELLETQFGANGYVDILDNFKYGVYARRCENLYIKALHFGSTYFNDNFILALKQPYSDYGIYFKDCPTALISQATIIPSKIGIQWYLDEDFTPQTSPSRFDNVTIDNIGNGSEKYGIIIAPDENPLVNTDPTVNASTTPMKIDITCSKIYDCTYGIVGSGIKTDWVMPTNSTNSLPGDFDPSIEFINSSDWNIIWSENIAWGITNQMKYYSASPYSNPLIQPINAISNPTLDGSSTVNNNYDSTTTLNKEPFSDPALLTVSGVYCQPSWLAYKKDPLSIEESIEKTRLAVFPNPFRDNLNIQLGDNEGSYIIVYNLLGKKMTEHATLTETISLETNSWPAGVYFISIYNDNSMETLKVLKQ